MEFISKGHGSSKNDSLIKSPTGTIVGHLKSLDFD
jgi:hypothetical protein